MNVQQEFDLGVRHHQAGRLTEAEALYRQVLNQQPNHADALHLLGVIAHQVDRNEIAIDLIRRAIEIKPNWPQALNNLGTALKGKGQLEEAVITYRHAIALKPDYAEAFNNMGVALKELGRVNDAMAAFEKAITLKPDGSEAHYNAGVALYESGHLDEAIAAFGRAISLNPDHPESHSNLGIVLTDQHRFSEGAAACRKAITLKPGYAEAYYNVGVALYGSGQLDEAVAAYRQAISLRPSYAEAYSNLGNALKDAGELDETIVCYRAAIALKPGFAEAHSNLGVALMEVGQVNEAIAACRTAIGLNPQSADAHHHLAIALLLTGNFSEGWTRYEYRWGAKHFASRPKYIQPQWNGSDLTGRTLLLYPEQGFGDLIQFARYIPLIAEKSGARVVMRCPPEMYRLLRTVLGAMELLAPEAPLPPFDAHCPLLSLPLAFGTTLETIPNTVAYLRAAPEAIERWRHRVQSPQLSITTPRRSLKIGLAWAGSSEHKRDRIRSMPLSTLAPLAEIPGVCFYSLQVGAASEQARNPPARMKLVDWTADLRDFADTAALITNLDLVISVDTVIVHLAGTLGKPVWNLLPFAPDWRWLLHRQDSPWYPTMRLFRQPRIGDWATVIGRVAEALREALLKTCPP